MARTMILRDLHIFTSKLRPFRLNSWGWARLAQIARDPQVSPHQAWVYVRCLRASLHVHHYNRSHAPVTHNPPLFDYRLVRGTTSADVASIGSLKPIECCKSPFALLAITNVPMCYLEGLRGALAPSPRRHTASCRQYLPYLLLKKNNRDITKFHIDK